MKEANIAEEFKKLFKFKSKEHEIRHDAFMVSARFLSEIERICEERKISRTKLAKKVKTSKSYLTQLFRGDKNISTSMVARMQKALKIKFEIKAIPHDPLTK